MPALPQLLIVAAGGAAGACARFALQQLPFDDSRRFCLTALVNLAGSFLIGLAWALFDALGAPRWASLLAIAGVLGGFTIFSAFSLETVRLVSEGRLAEAAGYVAVSTAGGIACCAAGIWLVNKILQ